MILFMDVYNCNMLRCQQLSYAKLCVNKIVINSLAVEISNIFSSTLHGFKKPLCNCPMLSVNSC